MKKIQQLKESLLTNRSIVSFAIWTIWSRNRSILVLKIFDESFDYIKSMAMLIITTVVFKHIQQNTLMALLNQYWFIAGVVALGFALVKTYVSGSISLTQELTMSRISDTLSDELARKVAEVDLDIRITQEFRDKHRQARRCTSYDIKQVAEWPIESFFNLLSAVSYIAALTWADWRLIAVGALFVVAILLFSRKTNKLSIEFERTNDKLRSIIDEYKSATTRIPYQLLRYSSFFFSRGNEWRDTSEAHLKKTRVTTQKIQAVVGTLQIAFGLFIMYLISKGLNKQDGLAELSILLMSAKGVMSTLVSFARQLSSLQKEGTDIKNYMEFLAQPNGNTTKRDDPIIVPVGTRLALHDVRFTYPANGENPPLDVLKGITFTFEPGKAYVIVGKNGCGKSTLVDTICQAKRPQHGAVHLGEVSLGDYTARQCMKPVCYVPQTGDLAELPVIESVFGTTNIDHLDQNRVDTALEWSGGATVVKGLPNGLETPIGDVFDNSRTLSGGQEQKLRIAAFLHAGLDPNVRVIIADEPARYLDPESRRQVYASLVRFAHQHRKVVIVVSHDAVLSNFDSVLVMDNGTIVRAYEGDQIPSSIDEVSRILAGDESRE